VEHQVALGRLALQDDHVGLFVGRLKIGQQPPFEVSGRRFSSPEMCFWAFCRWSGGSNVRRCREHVVRVQKKSSCMRSRPVTKLDVVDEQAAHLAVLLLEAGDAVEARRLQQLVGETLRGAVVRLGCRVGRRDTVLLAVSRWVLPRPAPPYMNKKIVQLTVGSATSWQAA
jgi:hypothetical protein